MKESLCGGSSMMSIDEDEMIMKPQERKMSEQLLKEVDENIMKFNQNMDSDESPIDEDEHFLDISPKKYNNDNEEMDDWKDRSSM